MRKTFNFFLLSLLFFAGFAQTKNRQLGIKPEAIEGMQYDVASATVPYSILKPNAPLSGLPAKKITDNFIITNRIDTLGIDFVYDSTVNPRALTVAYGEDGQAVAIQRKDDWVILDWRLFLPKSPAGMKMKWVDVDGKGTPELVFAGDSPERQILSSEVSRYTGRNYNTHENWYRATSLCIIDVDALSFLVQTIFTGYEYFYELSEHIKGPEHHDGGYIYPDAYDKDRQRKTLKVLYDFSIREGESEIEVHQIACEEIVIRDPSKQYTIKKDLSQPHVEKIESQNKKCVPMYEEGVYAFRDGKFLRVR